MQSVSSRIWTRVAVSIPYEDNHYTMGTSSCRFYEEVFHLLYEFPSLRLRSPVFPIEERLSRARFQLVTFLFLQYGIPPGYQKEANRYYTLPKGDLELFKAGVFNSLRYYIYLQGHSTPWGIMYTHIPTYIYIYIYIYMWYWLVYIYTYIHTYIYIYIYIYIKLVTVYINIHIYYICIYTRIHMTIH